MICSYCGNEREDMEGWHGCHQAQDAKTRIDETIDRITRIADHEEQLSEPWDRGRHRRLNDVAQDVRLHGGKVKPRGWGN